MVILGMRKKRIRSEMDGFSLDLCGEYIDIFGIFLLIVEGNE